MARRKVQNPGGSEIIWIAALAGAAYLAYEYLLAPNASANVVAAAASPAATGTPTSSGTPTASGSSSTGTTPAAGGGVVTPPLGSTVTNTANAALQAAANYPFIIPDAATNASLQGTGLNGYTMIVTSDAGPVWARNDVYAALQTAISALINRATAAYTSAGQTVPTAVYQNASQVMLNGNGSNSITSVMSAAGLHGLGLMGLLPIYQHYGWN